MFFRLDSKDILYGVFSFLLMCCLCGLVIYFRQSSDPEVFVSSGAATPAVPVWGGTPAKTQPTAGGRVGSPYSASPVPTGDVAAVASIQRPPHSHAFSDSIESDFYQTIIKKNLFAPLGTVLNPEPVPGTHLMLVATFVTKDPSASRVLVKNATTGHHHLLSVGEGIGDFHVLAVEPKHVRFYYHGTEVKVHLSDNVFLNAKRR